MPHSKKRRAAPAPAMLTMRQTAERLGRTHMTIRRLIRKGKLRAVLVGPNIMVLEDSLTEYLRPRPYTPQKPKPVCAGWNDKLREQLAREQAAEARP